MTCKKFQKISKFRRTSNATNSYHCMDGYIQSVLSDPHSDIIYGSYVVSKICISTHGFMTLGSITLGYSTCAFLYVITEFSTRAVILRMHLASHYARAGHSQMESVIRYVRNLQNQVHNCERSKC